MRALPRGERLAARRDKLGQIAAHAPHHAPTTFSALATSAAARAARATSPTAAAARASASAIIPTAVTAATAAAAPAATLAASRLLTHVGEVEQAGLDLLGARLTQWHHA